MCFLSDCSVFVCSKCFLIFFLILGLWVKTLCSNQSKHNRHYFSLSFSSQGEEKVERHCRRAKEWKRERGRRRGFYSNERETIRIFSFFFLMAKKMTTKTKVSCIFSKFPNTFFHPQKWVNSFIFNYHLFLITIYNLPTDQGNILT